MQHEQVNGNDWYGKSELAGDNQKASYTDQDSKSVPGVPPNSHAYKTHSTRHLMNWREADSLTGICAVVYLKRKIPFGIKV